MPAGMPTDFAHFRARRWLRDQPVRPISGRSGAALAALLATALGAGACTDPTAMGEASFAIAEPGPWHIPEATLAIGDGQHVEYTGAGPWIGEDGCGGGLLEGTAILREYLSLYFPQAYSIGGYACRPIVGAPTQMSVHATGRALDIMIETIGGEADNSLGDPIGNWLIENAELIGIQMIIWDRWLWKAEDAPPKDRAYTGEHPHHDHLHIELSVDAASLLTDFFGGPMLPPELVSCGTIGEGGGVIDDADRCAGFFGPREYWRAVDGEGHGGGLLWTNAFEGEAPSNWARWTVDMAAAGAYRAEVYLTPAYAGFDRVRYEIVADGEVEVVTLDQGAVTEAGWYDLGTFAFAAGGGQHVSVFDNSDGPVGEEPMIAFDALRLTRCDGDDCGASGGCSAGGGASGGAAAALGLALVGLLDRRRRRSR